MAIPDVGSEKVRDALRRFDTELRISVDWKSWEERKSYKFAIEADGQRYPPKQIVSMATGADVSAFSGGEETNDYLIARGFVVVPLRSRTIADLLERILADYPSARQREAFSSEAAMYKTFEQLELELSKEDIVERRKTLRVVASPGQGNWARVPWISFLDSRETDTTQRGVYVVILFRQDGSGFYLTFNQGVTAPKKELGGAAGIASVRRRAADLRSAECCASLGRLGFSLDDTIGLRADPGLGRDYEASTIAHKFYAAGSVPDDHELTKDLDALLNSYDAYLAKADKGAPILHLLLKWTPHLEQRTIEIHKAIADQRQSVWWGKFGRQGIGDEKLGKIQSQLSSGEPTYVFLSGAGTCYRTTLHEITTDKNSVDSPRFPTYYQREDCSFFCRISDFEELATDWLLANSVLDSNPVAGSTQGALQGQANPAYLRLVAPEGAWIFQGNPDDFDTRAAVRGLHQFRWLANRYADEMKQGDRVYVWESGANAGVVALADIAEPAQDVEEDEASRPYVKTPERFEGPRTRVMLRIVRTVEPHLSRETIKSDSRLANLSILRMANATNFKVSPAERKVIDELLAQRPRVPDDGKLCLIGTWRDVEGSYESVRTAIQEKGAWASPWSFPIREEAQRVLQPPFDLYINAGNGRIPIRLRVSEYKTARGTVGQVSPWPAITDEGWTGRTRSGDEDSEVFNTWLRVEEIELLAPALAITDFTPALGLSVAGSLLHAKTFGYAYRRSSGDPMDELVASTLLDRAVLEEIVSSVKNESPQIVFAGPPGTSKTWVAQAIAHYVAQADSRVRFVQFHPNYSYEAFVEGIRPIAEDGKIIFKEQRGALLDLVFDMNAANEVGSNAAQYVLVVDEMNRANLPRVFGELMYLFEYRNKSIRLQYSKDFALPSNLRFIATMNTADRSIRSIDVALRRRFDVFELKPDVAILRRFFAKFPLNVSNLFEGFERLNKQLEGALDRHHTIGHAFFMKPGLDKTQLQAVWRRKIFPLIEEYFFDQPDIANKDYSFDKFWP